MRKFLSLVLVIALAFSCFAVSASAAEIPQTTQTIEYLEDGSYFVTEIEESNSLARTSKTGSKTATYYTASDVKIFSVRVTGTFTYTYGVSASATSQTVNVILHHEDAKFITKSSSRSGATVRGSGTVSCLGLTIVKPVSLTCDIYGNLS